MKFIPFLIAFTMSFFFVSAQKNDEKNGFSFKSGDNVFVFAETTPNKKAVFTLYFQLSPEISVYDKTIIELFFKRLIPEFISKNSDVVNLESDLKFRHGNRFFSFESAKGNIDSVLWAANELFAFMAEEKAGFNPSENGKNVEMRQILSVSLNYLRNFQASADENSVETNEKIIENFLSNSQKLISVQFPEEHPQSEQTIRAALPELMKTSRSTFGNFDNLKPTIFFNETPNNTKTSFFIYFFTQKKHDLRNDLFKNLLVLKHENALGAMPDSSFIEDYTVSRQSFAETDIFTFSGKTPEGNFNRVFQSFFRPDSDFFSDSETEKYLRKNTLQLINKTEINRLRVKLLTDNSNFSQYEESLNELSQNYNAETFRSDYLKTISSEKCLIFISGNKTTLDSLLALTDFFDIRYKTGQNEEFKTIERHFGADDVIASYKNAVFFEKPVSYTIEGQYNFNSKTIETRENFTRKGKKFYSEIFLKIDSLQKISVQRATCDEKRIYLSTRPDSVAVFSPEDFRTADGYSKDYIELETQGKKSQLIGLSETDSSTVFKIKTGFSSNEYRISFYDSGTGFKIKHEDFDLQTDTHSAVSTVLFSDYRFLPETKKHISFRRQVFTNQYSADFSIIKTDFSVKIKPSDFKLRTQKK